MIFFRAAESVNDLARHRIFLAEALGMLVFVYAGDAATAQVLIGHHDRSLPTEDFYGGNAAVAAGCGLGLTLASALVGSVFDPPHLNPAVTVALAIFGDVRPGLVPVFLAAQACGATVGALFVAITHGTRLAALPEAVARRAYATYPTFEDYNPATLFWSELLSSVVYMLLYLAVFDRRNFGGNPGLTSVVAGSAYGALILACGMNSGSAANPARDFYPRLVSYLLGAGSAFDDSFPALPLLMPFAGCALGALLYFAAVGWFWPRERKAESEVVDDLLLDVQDEVEELKALFFPKSEGSEKEEDKLEDGSSEESLLHMGLAQPTKTEYENFYY